MRGKGGDLSLFIIQFLKDQSNFSFLIFTNNFVAFGDSIVCIVTFLQKAHQTHVLQPSHNLKQSILRRQHSTTISPVAIRNNEIIPRLLPDLGMLLGEPGELKAPIVDEFHLPLAIHAGTLSNGEKAHLQTCDAAEA